jgi:ABC-type transporter lipoprotein component MlaA
MTVTTLGQTISRVGVEAGSWLMEQSPVWGPQSLRKGSIYQA